jgi:hypothetical protein
MAEVELPDRRVVTVEISLDAFAAAAECGESIAQWIDEAMQQRLDDRATAQRTAACWQPGPWPGWETFSSTVGNLEFLTYHGPGGVEIHYSSLGFSYDRSRWRGASSRPWMARTTDACLRTRDGKVRVFHTAEAARDALHA